MALTTFFTNTSLLSDTGFVNHDKDFFYSYRKAYVWQIYIATFIIEDRQTDYALSADQ